MTLSITYTSPYIPAEWIEAHGLRPRRILPPLATNDGLDGMSGLCPFARAFTDECNSSSGPFIFVTSCDQMRRLSEFAFVRESRLQAEFVDTVPPEGRTPERSIFLFNMPSTCETAASLRLYISELRRLSEFLIGLGGEPPSRDRLVEIMHAYDRGRRALREARGAMSAGIFARVLASYFEGPDEFFLPKDGILCDGIPLALIGSPVMRPHLNFFDLVEDVGGEIVLDATAGGERSLPRAFDWRELANTPDPLLVLAEAYFEIPSAFRRPNSGLYRYLKAELESRGVRGIIFRTCVWCDTWRAEAARIRDWSGLPMLELDVTDEPAPNGSAMTRLQSFIEILQ